MKLNETWMKTAILFCGITLAACTNDDNPVVQPGDDVEEQLAKMTLREKVGQMFYVRTEALDTTIHWTSYTELMPLELREVNDRMKTLCEDYPVGGVILYAWNINDEAQLATLIAQIKALNGSPLLCIDEEGGRVARIANNPNFDVKKYESMEAIGNTGDPANAYECGNTIGTYLQQYGFDIDFAPVADVNTNPENIVIGPRAFSGDPAVAAPMVTNYLQGLKDAGITGCIKHFPGHGDTKADTHYGYAQTMKTWAEMLQCEMVTFRAGIEWGCQLIMTAHIAAPNVTGADVPSTMSSIILQDKLRGELGYQNIIVTDAISMGAITNQYSTAEAAVGSILAGVDIVLDPSNYIVAFEAVMSAIDNGTITEDRINQSVRRILRLRKSMGK
jgi:beta-N-acetylhexosaminidase